MEPWLHFDHDEGIDTVLNQGCFLVYMLLSADIS